MTAPTKIGVRIAPTFEPALNKPTANARSRCGIHSATALSDAGEFPDSPHMDSTVNASVKPRSAEYVAKAAWCDGAGNGADFCRAATGLAPESRATRHSPHQSDQSSLPQVNAKQNQQRNADHTDEVPRLSGLIRPIRDFIRENPVSLLLFGCSSLTGVPFHSDSDPNGAPSRKRPRRAYLNAHGRTRPLKHYRTPRARAGRR